MEKKFCKFCDIIENKPEQKLFEDDKICIFFSIPQIAYVHMQCIPKIHIKNINSLTYKHIPLLYHMKETVIQFLTKKYYIDSNIIIMGFHIPPFNSVQHLHMHCIIPPLNNCIEKLLKVDCVMRRIDNQIYRLLKDKKNCEEINLKS